MKRRADFQRVGGLGKKRERPAGRENESESNLHLLFTSFFSASPRALAARRLHHPMQPASAPPGAWARSPMGAPTAAALAFVFATVAR